MKRKRMSLMLVSFMTIVLLFSCGDDDKTTPKPSVTITELGLENSGIAYIGTDLHVEAEIVAQGKIDKIRVEIHPEGSHEEDGGEEIEIVYDEFNGRKNTTFHKHIDIPSTIKAGDYHFHFEVLDMEGQETLVEKELKIEKSTDSEKPQIEITNAPKENTVFHNGEEIKIEGTVKDNIALGGMLVGLVRADAGVKDEDVKPNTSIVLLHTHTFTHENSHEFTASINVGASEDKNMTPKDLKDTDWASGDYYLLVKCKDNSGNWSFTQHYPIKIAK